MRICMVKDSKPAVFLPVDKQANVMRNIARSSQHPCYARDNFANILYHEILIDVGKIAANGEHVARIPMSYIKNKLLATNPLMSVITIYHTREKVIEKLKDDGFKVYQDAGDGVIPISWYEEDYEE